MQPSTAAAAAAFSPLAKCVFVPFLRELQLIA
jgi:hypothetical protein